MKLQDALDATLQRRVMPALEAIPQRDRRKIQVQPGVRLTGSLDLDDCLRALQPQANRWDYVIGKHIDELNDGAVYLEVHPADSHGVDAVLRKLRWLWDWIQTQPGMNRLHPARYVWVASGDIQIQKFAPQWKRLAQTKIGNVCIEGVFKMCVIN